MAAREGWGVIGEYADAASSAWSGNRGPQLAAAMEHAERAAPAALLVQHSDRLARGDGRTARHLAEIYFWAIKRDVDLRSVQDDSTFTNPLLVMALGERNAEDSRRKSLAVKAGMQRRRAKGLHTGGPRPYGYRYARDGTGLVVIEAEAAVVRRLFAEYVAGRNQLAITRALIADRIPTARGGAWHQGTIRNILANPLYAGLLGEDLIPAVHKPIVDREVWEKARALREARTRTSAAGRPPAGRHLFRKGMLRCECGEALVPRTARNRSGTLYEVYRCYGRHRDPDSCSMEPLKRAEIDTAVYRYFEQVGLDVEATRRQLADARDRKLSEVEALHSQAEAEKRRAEERLARVRRDYADGKLSAEDWAEFREELTAEMRAAGAEVDRLATQAVEVEAWSGLRDAERDTLANLADLRRAIAGEVQEAEGVEAVRAALSRLFEHFVVRRRASQRVHAELAWLGDFVLEPVVREQALEGYSSLRPVFRREPLYNAGENYADGLTR